MSCASLSSTEQTREEAGFKPRQSGSGSARPPAILRLSRQRRGPVAISVSQPSHQSIFLAPAWCCGSHQNSGCKAWLGSLAVMQVRHILRKQIIITCLFARHSKYPSCPDIENHSYPPGGDFWEKGFPWPACMAHLKWSELLTTWGITFAPLRKKGTDKAGLTAGEAEEDFFVWLRKE